NDQAQARSLHGHAVRSVSILVSPMVIDINVARPVLKLAISVIVLQVLQPAEASRDHHDGSDQRWHHRNLRQASRWRAPEAAEEDAAVPAEERGLCWTRPDLWNHKEQSA
ncbi:unnamed protein product, partial [Prorocentrum cordatum]